MNKIIFIFTTVSIFFSCSATAQVDSKKDDAKRNIIILSKSSRKNITIFLFKKNKELIYRLVCTGSSLQRTFFSTDLGFRVTEYDLNFDGKIDAIQIGHDDSNFSAFIVNEMKDGLIDISRLPDGWDNGSKYPFDTFIEYVRKQKKLGCVE